MNIKWEWEPFESSEGPPVPIFCDKGPFSHTWEFEYSQDGSSLSTEECEPCNAVMQSPYCDMFEHLVAAFKVSITPRVERGLEVDYFVDMEPVHE